MDKSRIGLVGAISSLVALPLGASAAAPTAPAIPPAQSYADLFQPISNPVERLQLADAQEAAQARLIPAQYQQYDRYHHHHHHHHHHHSRRWYQSRGYYWYDGGWVLRPVRRDHHHHHHHHHHHNHY